MSLIRRKDKPRYFHELLLPETWVEQQKLEAEGPEDIQFLDEEIQDEKHNSFMTRMHTKKRDSQLSALKDLFDEENEARFDLDQFKILEVYPVLYMGWECDYLMWLVQHRGKRFMIGTDHGSLRLLSEKDIQKEEIKLQEALIATRQGLLALKV